MTMVPREVEHALATLQLWSPEAKITGNKNAFGQVELGWFYNSLNAFSNLTIGKGKQILPPLVFPTNVALDIVPAGCFLSKMNDEIDSLLHKTTTNIPRQRGHIYANQTSRSLGKRPHPKSDEDETVESITAMIRKRRASVPLQQVMR